MPPIAKAIIFFSYLYLVYHKFFKLNKEYCNQIKKALEVLSSSALTFIKSYLAAAFTSVKNESGSSEAPPTKAPSISDCANNSSTLFGLTEPP